MPTNPNFTITTGRVTNALLTACLVLGGVVYNGLNDKVEKLETKIESVENNVYLLVSALNEKGLNIEVNKERLNSVEKRVEALERKVGLIYSNKFELTLFKPEEEIRFKKQIYTWIT